MKQILIEKYIEPSEIIIDGDIIVKKWLDKYGDLHSFMGHPAEIWYKNGQIHHKRWYKKNKLHRDRCLPSSIAYKNERIIHQSWCKEGKSIKGSIFKNKK